LIEPSLEEKPQEDQPQEDNFQEDQPQTEKTALTIHIHSWATPIVGFLMLVVGLLAGYFVRPVVSPLLSKVTPTPTASASADTGESTASQPGLKDYVVAQTTHFLGDPNAPVTIIEFSDFQ